MNSGGRNRNQFLNLFGNTRKLINKYKNVNIDYEYSESEEERDFTFEERLRIEHLDNKREGMQKITFENIKDGLYNAKELMVHGN